MGEEDETKDVTYFTENSHRPCSRDRMLTQVFEILCLVAALLGIKGYLPGGFMGSDRSFNMVAQSIR